MPARTVPGRCRAGQGAAPGAAGAWGHPTSGDVTQTPRRPSLGLRGHGHPLPPAAPAVCHASSGTVPETPSRPQSPARDREAAGHGVCDLRASAACVLRVAWVGGSSPGAEPPGRRPPASAAARPGADGRCLAERVPALHDALGQAGPGVPGVGERAGRRAHGGWVGSGAAPCGAVPAGAGHRTFVQAGLGAGTFQLPRTRCRDAGCGRSPRPAASRRGPALRSEVAGSPHASLCSLSACTCPDETRKTRPSPSPVKEPPARRPTPGPSAKRRAPTSLRVDAARWPASGSSFRPRCCCPGHVSGQRDTDGASGAWHARGALPEPPAPG